MTIAFDIRTTPFSRWSVPNAPDEPAHSYFARLVAQEGHNSVAVYSDGIDVDARSMNPERMLKVLLKLPLTEERKRNLTHATAVRSSYGYRLAGQHFNAKDLSFSSRRWCPGCLHESAHHRAWWDITAISRCPLHDTPLQDKDEDGKELHWWWPFIDTTPGGFSLAKGLPRVPEPGGFTFYLMSRCGFADAVSCPRLDPLPLGTVIDACEMVGKLVSSGWSEDVPETAPAHFEAGYEVLRGDGAAVVEHLREWLRKSVPHTMHARGYTIVYGWANRRRQVLGDEGLSKFFQKAFRKALALEARGSAETMTSEQFEGHQIGLTELAARIGVNRKGLPAVADALGLLPEREWYRAPVKFDPIEADTIEHHVRRMMTRVEAATALGMASQDIQPLVDAGFLRSFSNVIGEGPVGHRFLAVDIERLLNQIGGAVKIDHAKSISFFTYARNSAMRMGDVAVKILTGEIEAIGGKNCKPGFKGLRVIRR